MKIKYFLLLSIILHSVIVTLLLRLPLMPPEQKPGGPLIARLVEPEPTPPPRVLHKEAPSIGIPEKRPPEPGKRAPKFSAKPPVQKKHTLKKKKPLPSKKKKSITPFGGEGLRKPAKPSVPGKGVREGKAAPHVTKKGGSREGFLSEKELLDKKIIGEVARKSQAKKKKDNPAVTFSTRELKYYSYMMKLKNRIENIWTYPRSAAAQGIYGDLYIRFTIKKDGYLGAVELVRTSGYRELDEAAIQALRDGEPYWPLPEKWKQKGFTITGHFIYTLYGTYIR